MADENRMKITVYCGAASGDDPKYAAAAKRLGEWVAANNDELVYGGGGVGLMGVVAQAVLDGGGKVHGIMPQMLIDRNAAAKGLTTMEVVDDMDERKRRMMELGDVLIAFPGGPGTLEEIAEAISWSRIGLNNKPCVLFDLDGYWRPLAQMYDVMVSAGFLTAADRSKLLVTDSVDEITRFAATYQPPKVRTFPERK
ncbi:TIGR00730 family Rossman fold protein [Bifidobacterium sp. ESL0745]|uniref:LOG family protein n=1 Tax=Bifidobacterium sp. ESL0745 TaxID=2983226 RepID=UPI0023F89EC7|nr:TIGR00730 family Rossman fold protein [Bifidobacterium sp. ESL0745]MDF7665927.1 TIGR00730 family Rossman fold protein [Bifidobacterium sp. ESL0745]